MSQPVGRRIDAGIAVLTLQNAPLNALTPSVRAALIDALEAVLADDEVLAVVIAGAGTTFSGGLDISEHDRGAEQPDLATLCRAVAGARKPVVAALKGTVLGAGLELALAAHARVAAPQTRLGLPDISLGLIPGAGATQRAPRLAGADAALELMLGARALPVSTGAARGLVDALASQDVLAEAQAMALGLAQSDWTPGREDRRGLDQPAAYQKTVAEYRAALGTRAEDPSGHALVDCVEAALLLPLEAGLDFEAALFEELRDSDRSRALRHLYRAERRAVAQARPRRDTPATATAHGEGAALAGLCLLLLDHGAAVELGAGAAGLRGQIDAVYARAEERGRLSPAERAERMARLSDLGEGGESGAGGALLISAAFDADRAGEIVQSSGRRMVAVVAQQGEDIVPPGGAAGIVLTAPAHVNRAAELLLDETVAEDEAQGLRALLARIGKLPVVVRGSGAGAGATLAAGLRRALSDMVMSGTAPQDIDRALAAEGFQPAPFFAWDRDGLDRGAEAETTLAALMVQSGRRGRASGGGFYRYGADGAEADLETEALIAGARQVSSQPLSAAEIRACCMAALAHAGAGLLEEKRLASAGEVDLLAVHGLGVPRTSGGPMKAADMRGLFETRKLLRAMGWEDRPLLDELIKNGRRFCD